MDSIKIDKDRSCALRVLEGHKPKEYRLSHFEQPAPLITSYLNQEISPHDSASTQSPTSSLWSGVPSQCGSTSSRATSIAPSLKSHKRQQSASSLSYLQIKPLPPLPAEEPSPPSSSSPKISNLQLPMSKLCLSPSKFQHQKDLASTDRPTSPLISPALSNVTASSASSYASHLVKNPIDSFREYIRIFHPHSQSSHITAATLDTGSDCCCIRLDVLHSLGVPLTSSLVRPTTLFFVGYKGLPCPILLGKDFLFPKEGPPRVFAILVNVLNRPSKG
jgi:hypothetical protein